MKIILTENIKGLGQMGDIKEVRDGYGRNFLLPRNLAILATEGNLKKQEELKAKRKEAEKQELKHMQQLVEKLKDLKMEIKTKADEKGNLYAAIHPEEITQALKEQGIDVNPNYIVIPEEIKKLGEHQVLFKHSEDIQTEFTITLH